MIGHYTPPYKHGGPLPQAEGLNKHDGDMGPDPEGEDLNPWRGDLLAIHSKTKRPKAPKPIALHRQK